MSESWSFGYSDPFGSEECSLDVIWGEETTFALAVKALYDNVLAEAAKSESYQDDHFAQVLDDISGIMCDPGIMDDPDQWEDMSFHDELGEIEYFVVQN